MRKAKLLLITAVMAVILAVPAHAASVGGAQVRAGSLNLRSAPSTSSSILTTAGSDAYVVVGDITNQAWYKVVYRGYTGYMNASYLNFSNSLDGNYGNGTIRGESVALRTDANIFAQNLGYCANGTVVRVLGVSGSWYKVQYGSTVGYIQSNSVSLTPEANSSTAAADAKLAAAEAETKAGQTIVDTAMKYLGCPYVYGGTSSNGFDCSGFVQYVYKECGYSTERTAASIYSANGVAVDKSALEPGDVVCFSSSSESIGHVGIYIGNGQFIHACNASTGVIISPLDMDYWATNYVGAKRIVTADSSAATASATSTN